MDTIYALSTAPGKAGIAVIRVSGPLAHKAVEHLCGALPKPRMATRRVLSDGAGSFLDDALVLTFEDKASFTGEPVAEFHLHGSVAVVSAVSTVLQDELGLLAAEPGEFTRRALENGNMDLTQVEGLADLIEAETEAQRHQALRVFSGELSQKVERWRRNLIGAAALIEATIDFADEDVPVDVSPEVSALLHEVEEELRANISGYDAAERVRTGFEVAIVGRPNIGKSTLLNALAGREAAITSRHAGTTRDVIEVRMDLKGVPVTVLDTAGLRETSDEVEAIGVERARERARLADIRVFLVDPNGEKNPLEHPEDIVLIGQIDQRAECGNGISGLTGQGVPELIEKLSNVLKTRASHNSAAIRLRHQVAMQSGLQRLQQAQMLVMDGSEETEFIAEELRQAVKALDSLVGKVDIENILDEIFASFCLGK